MIGQGGASRAEALKVGAKIEDLDIVDLGEWSAKTSQADIRTVYSNLARGSRNHLRAFVSGLKALGLEYRPERLTADEFKKIVGSPHERGRGG